MINIIDANNLAGKLEILGEDNFDQLLIKRLAQYKNKKFILVFDSRETMGDKYQLGNIKVVYTPRDNYYKSADDKIIELIGQYLASREEVKLITDDLEMTDRAEKLAGEIGGNIFLEKSSRFAEKLKYAMTRRLAEKELVDDDVDKINRDLLNIWK